MKEIAPVKPVNAIKTDFKLFFLTQNTQPYRAIAKKAYICLFHRQR